jgi:threonine/homoserine/homoserine lactone efflux protein
MEIFTLVFLSTSAIIILITNQDMILVMFYSIAQGQKAGIMTSFGVRLLVHTLLATLEFGEFTPQPNNSNIINCKLIS